MKALEEKIIEILKNPHWFLNGKLFESDFERIADAILALASTERHYCKSCGEELDDYCLKCQKLWES